MVRCTSSSSSRASRTTRSSSCAACAVGATVVGVGERPKDWLDDDVKQWLTHYEQVPSVTDEGRLAEAVQWVQHRAPVERLEATVEAHVMPAGARRGPRHPGDIGAHGVPLPRQAGA